MKNNNSSTPTVKEQGEKDKPLFKVLNEQRSSGVWYTGNDPSFLYCKKDSPHICKFNEGVKCNDRSQAQNDAAYTALAVNNLHILAEALERILEVEDTAFGLRSFDTTRFKKNIRDALKAIS